MTVVTGSPGVRPSQILDKLDDRKAKRLLPGGALELVKAVDPDRVRGPKRADVLGEMLSVEFAVDDQRRRKLLLSAVPVAKIGELEERTGCRVEQLMQEDRLDGPVSRLLLVSSHTSYVA